ncbi:hypothetical protein PV08_10041 [Exophiala spinifera]|uniref:NAD-dependent epimerase/dehydratase domain-containing protein n=1 Tax=Exophiala spinifera TaxID=91928 RepID=A0A0D1ZCH5_9EURO|nr:uncharacterized protein PV08_10041 [Exophiala spinifera]KIW10742.1 hypothetical protein PV08_10041 [Exophiala spinifera]
MVANKPLVLVTGATGFVGAHVVRHLLELSRYRVVIPVRSMAKSSYIKERYASEIASKDLEMVSVADLSAPHALDDVLKRFQPEYIVHLASPYFTTTNDPIKDLVQPAVGATRNVMTSALEYGAPALKRFTLLSSFASVVDLSKNPRPGYTYTASDWDPVTEEQAAENGFFGYHASKTFAERLAWDLHDHGLNKELPSPPTFGLVTLCPPMIYGPPIHYAPGHLMPKSIEELNTSTARLISGITGKDPAFTPRVATPGLPAWIDVRDIAKAIAGSLTLDPARNERILLCGGVDYFEDGLGRLRTQNISGLGDPGDKCDPSNHFDIDRTKMRDVLNLQETIPFEKTVEDTFNAVRGMSLV